MNINDLENFNAMFEAVCEYYGRKTSPMLAEIYWRGMQGYEFADVRRAFDAHMHNADSGQFMPKIADVERHIHGNTGTRAMQAWNKISKAIQEVGTYTTVKFDDPLIHACIDDMGGWPAIGQILNDELPFKIREFEKRYMAYLQVPPVRKPPPVLIGIYERTNLTLGYRETTEPVLIGNDGITAPALDAPEKE